MTRTVLLTRPQDDSKKLEKYIVGISSEIRTIIAPVFTISPIGFDPISAQIDALIFTSRHAVRMCDDRCLNLTAYCVGDATEKVAKKSGFETISASADAAALIELLKDSGIKNALHLRGKHTRGSVAENLTAAGISTESCVVYDQIKRPWSKKEWDKIQKSTDLIVPVYSPRTSQIVSRRLNGFEGNVTLVSISKAARDAWDGPELHKAIVAQKPDASAMKYTIKSLLA